MSSFERFQARNKAHKLATEKLNSTFIFKGLPSIKITQNDVEIQAAVVNKQEKDCAYIYTTKDNPLDIGSIWCAKNLHLLISEEITVIYDVNWHKYKAFLCNVQIDDVWGYFKGPEKTYINLTLKEGAFLESEAKPVLVLPSSKMLSFKDKILIKDRAWAVQEYDNYSMEGIVYYSLAPSSISKKIKNDNTQLINQEKKNEANFIQNKEEKSSYPLKNTNQDNNFYSFSPNAEIRVETENAFFKADINVQIIKRTANEIIFKIPFGIERCTIEIQRGGKVVSKTYEIK